MASSRHHHNHQCGHSHDHQKHEHRVQDGDQGGDGGGEGVDNNVLDEMHPCCQKDAASKARYGMCLRYLFVYS